MRRIVTMEVTVFTADGSHLSEYAVVKFTRLKNSFVRQFMLTLIDTIIFATNFYTISSLESSQLVIDTIGFQ